MAVCLLIAAVGLFYLAPWSRQTREILVLIGVGLLALATFLVIFSRCPRCGHLFHNVQGFNNPLSKNCAGCRLSLDDRQDG